MHKSIFNYTLTRPFPYPWLPWVVFLGGICTTTILTVLNLAANGYELHNAYTSNPNVTMSSSNSAWFERTPWSWIAKVLPTCQAQSITTGSSISTYNYGLQYTISSLSTSEENITTQFYSTSYLNDYLHKCAIEYIKIKSGGGWSLSFYADSICTIFNGSAPIDLAMTISIELRQLLKESNTIEFFQPYYNADATSPSRNPLLYSSAQLGQSIMLWNLNLLLWITDYDLEWEASWAFPLSGSDRSRDSPASTHGEILYHPGGNDSTTTCTFFEFNDTATWTSTFGVDIVAQRGRNITLNKGDYVETGYDDDGVDPFANASVYIDGLAKSWYSIVLSDLGQPNESNILASPRQTLKFMNESIQFSLAFNLDPLGSWYGMLALSQIPTQLPPSDIDGFYRWAQLSPPHVEPTTIVAQYLCQVPKLKSKGSLFVSVVVADFVFLQIVWTIFSWVTAYFLESRRPDAQYCAGCTKAVALGQLQLDDPESESQLNQQKSSHTKRVTAPEPALTWSDSISSGRDGGDTSSEPTRAPLVWSDSLGDTTAETILRRRNDESAHSLLASQ